jgi:hypothetical protein
MALPIHDFQLSLRAIKHKVFSRIPAAAAEKARLRAVILDCEIAGIANGAGEAIFLCPADYVTGAVLSRLICMPD